MLQKDLIEQPQIWQLVLEITSQAIDVVAFSPYEDHSLIYERISLDTDATSHLKAVENAIYDNPLLLSDFRSVTVLYDTQRFLPVPLPAVSLAEPLFRRAFPTIADMPGSVVGVALSTIDVAIAFELPDDMLGFLRRTFHNLSIQHPLASQAAWLRSKYPTRPNGKTLVNLQPGRIDIVILGEKAPLTVNSFRVNEPMDALYYIMAARQLHALNADDEIFIAGDRKLRTVVSSLLRKYVRFVMPAIFPSLMFRAGKASLEAPFEMILTPVTADLTEPIS